MATAAFSLAGMATRLRRLIDTRAAFLLAAAALISRDPGHLWHAQLWAEDGLWFHDAYTYGWASLFRPHTGYLQTLPRVVALAAMSLPATLVPGAFAAAGLVVQLTPVALILARGAVLIPSPVARLALIAFYIGAPNSFETFLNLTDAQWHVAIIIFLWVVLPLPNGWTGRAIQFLGLIIGGLSGPFSIFLMPIAWWTALLATAQRKGKFLQAGIVSLTALIQGLVIITQPHSRSPAPDGASFDALAHLIVGQIFLCSLFGLKFLANVMQSGIWKPAAVDATFILFLLILLLAFYRGGQLYRMFLIYTVLVLTISLASPVASGSEPQWQALSVPGAGNRYYLLPILAWFAAVLTLAGDQSALVRWPFRLLVPFFMIGIAADWRYPPLLPTTYQDAARRFDAAPPGTTVMFPEDPDPHVWVFALVKH